MRQLKTFLTIYERGSESATTSVFDCQCSPVGRLMAIEKSVSNYFWSTFVDHMTFSIATNPVLILCKLHYVTVDISA